MMSRTDVARNNNKPPLTATLTRTTLLHEEERARFSLFASGTEQTLRVSTVMVKLTHSEARSAGAVPPASSPLAAAAAAAVQRCHVASLAVVDTSVLAAAHLADRRRKHHLDPLPPPSSSPACGRLPVSRQSREEEDGGQKAEDLRLQHVECVSPNLCPPLLPPAPFVSTQNERLGEEGGK